VYFPLSYWLLSTENYIAVVIPLAEATRFLAVAAATTITFVVREINNVDSATCKAPATTTGPHALGRPRSGQSRGGGKQN
jgi:hypothetical protein